MSIIGSSLSKGEDGTGLLNPAVLRQLAGVPKDMSRSAFDAAVTQERANITNNGTGVWSNGEKISIFGEAGTRVWFVGASASLSHARNVAYQGQVYALAADANVFGSTNGAPASGTGANGDYLVDGAAGLVYGPKAAGTWPAGVATLVASATVASLPAITDLTADFSLPAENGTSSGARLTRAQIIALLLANDGSVDETTLTPMTQSQASAATYRAILNGAPATLSFATLCAAVAAVIVASSSGSSGSSGTTTATSMTLTQSATSGTSDVLTIAPVGGVWPSGTLTLAATLSGGATGSLGSVTGGTSSSGVITPTAGSGAVTVTFTGSANGTAAFALTNTIGLANPAGLNFTVSGVGSTSTYPALTFSTAGTFDTTAPKFGTAALVGPAVATAPISLGAGNNQFCIEAWVFVSDASNSYASTPSLGITDGTNTLGEIFDFNRVSATKAVGTSLQNYGSPVVGDGAWHYVVANFDGNEVCSNTDGGTYGSNGAATFTGGANCTFMLNVPAGHRVDAIKVSKVSKYPVGVAAPVPTAAPVRDANTVVIWQLDGNGTGS